MYLEFPGNFLLKLEEVCCVRFHNRKVSMAVQCFGGIIESSFNTDKDAEQKFNDIAALLKAKYPSTFFKAPNGTYFNLTKIVCLRLNGFKVDIYTPIPNMALFVDFESQSEAKEFYHSLKDSMEGKKCLPFA